MKLLIGNMDHKMQEFIKHCDFSEKMLLINKMCNVKLIKEEVDIIIPFNIILNSGLISNTLVHLEELLITLEVKKVIYTNNYNEVFFNKLQNQYQVPFEFMDLTTSQIPYHF